MTSEVYLIGSLRNPEIPKFAREIREETGLAVFDDWFSPGPEADDYWKKYEMARGRSYEEALKGYAGTHVYHFDKSHIDRCDIGLLMMPAGKSGHLELGVMIGSGKPGIIYMDSPDRWDVMVQFANENNGGIFFDKETLFAHLVKLKQDLKLNWNNTLGDPNG